MKECLGTLKPISGTCKDCPYGKECLDKYYKLNGMKQGRPMKKPQSIIDGFLYPVKYERIPSLHDRVIFIVHKGEK